MTGTADHEPNPASPEQAVNPYQEFEAPIDLTIHIGEQTLAGSEIDWSAVLERTKEFGHKVGANNLAQLAVEGILSAKNRAEDERRLEAQFEVAQTLQGLVGNLDDIAGAIHSSTSKLDEESGNLRVGTNRAEAVVEDLNSGVNKLSGVIENSRLSHIAGQLNETLDPSNVYRLSHAAEQLEEAGRNNLHAANMMQNGGRGY